jgi:hypothetical protein
MDTYTVTDDRGHTATWDYDSAALTDVVCDWLNMGQMVSGYSATVKELLATIDTAVGAGLYIGTMTDTLGLIIEPAA